MKSQPQTAASRTETLDPKRVPSRILKNGAQIPAIGFGTFGSDHAPHETVAEAVRYAASIGYRHFDCASVYGNEHRIGRAFRELLQSGLHREEVWITSKLWNDKHGEEDVITSCERSAGGFAGRLPRSFSGPLAISQSSSSGM